MKKIVFAATFALVTLMGCNFGFSKGEGGMLYKLIEDKDGKNVQIGDFVSFNAVVKTDKDSVLYSSYDEGRPRMLMIRNPSYKGDMYDAFTYLSEGDSAIVKLSADTLMARTGQPLPPQLKGVSYIIYQIKIIKVIASEGLTEEDFQSKVTGYFEAENKNERMKEEDLRNKYISFNNLKPAVTSSGLNYVITRMGGMGHSQKGDTVVVHYVGKLLNGKVFDTSIKAVAEKNKISDTRRDYTPIRFPVGLGQVIPGWDEGIQLLGKGARATFVIPSKLAYGEQGVTDVIPPYSTLVFEVELVDIISGNKKTPVVPQKAMAEAKEKSAPPKKEKPVKKK